MPPRCPLWLLLLPSQRGIAPDESPVAKAMSAAVPAADPVEGLFGVALPTCPAACSRGLPLPDPAMNPPLLRPLPLSPAPPRTARGVDPSVSTLSPESTRWMAEVRRRRPLVPLAKPRPLVLDATATPPPEASVAAPVAAPSAPAALAPAAAPPPSPPTAAGSTWAATASSRALCKPACLAGRADSRATDSGAAVPPGGPAAPEGPTLPTSAAASSAPPGRRGLAAWSELAAGKRPRCAPPQGDGRRLAGGGASVPVPAMPLSGVRESPAAAAASTESLKPEPDGCSLLLRSQPAKRSPLPVAPRPPRLGCWCWRPRAGWSMAPLRDFPPAVW
mmetsp:Transcript_11448/g.44320  ORF Transcript_11448/g.44320 Transcript_11448/m.44320 type:complete len:333 (-) Transcript_11448:35-1033(-)